MASLASDSTATTTYRHGNPQFKIIPPSVQALIDEPSASVDRFLVCSNCRSTGEDGEETPKQQRQQPKKKKLVRCSRCHLTYYCSQTCQKQHFKLHKKNCKAVACQTEDSSDLLIGGPGDGIVEMGYTESDTLEHGRHYYRQALRVFVHSIRRTQFSPGTEDKILLLLAILGANEQTICDWCFQTGSPRQQYMLIQREENKTINSNNSNYRLTKEDDIGNDFPFCVLRLFVTMRTLAEYRRDLAAWNAFHDHMMKSQNNTADAIPDGIYNLIRPFVLLQGNSPALLVQDGYDGHDGYSCVDSLLSRKIESIIGRLHLDKHLPSLVHLRDTIPFQRHHAEHFIRPHDAPTIMDAIQKTFQSQCYWHLLQDCFFLTPNVRTMMDEFMDELIEIEDEDD